jgi:hypothetical protein
VTQRTSNLTRARNITTTVFLWVLFLAPLALGMSSLVRGNLAEGIGGLLIAALVFPGAVIQVFVKSGRLSPLHAVQIETKLMTIGVMGLAATGFALVVGLSGSSSGSGVFLLIGAGAMAFVVGRGRRRLARSTSVGTSEPEPPTG